mmetsp:Transcript_11708/g.9991  ORF Transcript_11708/g.9991 Transcript_11708/m.9991 type:complete len:83 (+) Transcript_11708:134-382(+)
MYRASVKSRRVLNQNRGLGKAIRILKLQRISSSLSSKDSLEVKKPSEGQLFRIIQKQCTNNMVLLIIPNSRPFFITITLSIG